MITEYHVVFYARVELGRVCHCHRYLSALQMRLRFFAKVRLHMQADLLVVRFDHTPAVRPNA